MSDCGISCSHTFTFRHTGIRDHFLLKTSAASFKYIVLFDTRKSILKLKHT